MDLCACRTYLPNEDLPRPGRTHLLEWSSFCACRTHLLKISFHLAELTFWTDIFYTTQNSPANRHPCGMQNSPVETRTTYLLNWTLCLEENTSSQQFSKNAAHTPDINCSWIVTRSHQNLWCTVVLCHHLLCHVLWLIRLFYPCQTKVTDLRTQQKIWLYMLYNKVK